MSWTEQEQKQQIERGEFACDGGHKWTSMDGPFSGLDCRACPRCKRASRLYYVYTGAPSGWDNI